jgi:BirA family transcriptional regulator, biotin operon repressor / biotin---[acetyl-CoA-carboxylase] ligase
MSRVARTHVQVLHLLKEKQGNFVSGTSLASRLNMSRTSVWKHIQNLRSLGYDIISHPKEGYRLREIPDLLIPEEIVPHLATSWLARAYHHYRQIGSTNDEALLLAAQGAEHGTVVVAEEQTKGRGRLQRSWFSPAGCGIYLSMILRNPLPLQEAPQSPMVAALALVKVLDEDYGLPASIKWPNDVLVAGKKLSGILADMQSDQDYTRFIVIGMGINVNHTESDLAEPFRYPATSLAIELGAPVKRQELLLKLIHRFERAFERFLDDGFGAMLPEFEKASAILGKELRIQSGKEEISGKALGFTPEGALRLLKEDGKVEVVWVGDVLRVAGPYETSLSLLR